MGSCGGISEGGHVCGWYESDGVNALRAIYVCTNSRLVRAEVCKENKKNNRCVKNMRKKGKKFFPLNNPDQIVCMKKASDDASNMYGYGMMVRKHLRSKFLLKFLVHIFRQLLS